MQLRDGIVDKRWQIFPTDVLGVDLRLCLLPEPAERA
jgi:hypothetical protein